MADQLKFYINGEWVDPLSSETIEVIKFAQIIGYKTIISHKR